MVCAELPEAVLVVWLDTATRKAVAVFEDTALADAFEELTAGACELLEEWRMRQDCLRGKRGIARRCLKRHPAQAPASKLQPMRVRGHP